MLSLNELCQGENPLWSKGRGMSRRISALQGKGQGCGEGAGQQGKELCLGRGRMLEAASFPGRPQLSRLSPTATQLFSLFFPLSFSPIYLFDTFNDAPAD